MATHDPAVNLSAETISIRPNYDAIFGQFQRSIEGHLRTFGTMSAPELALARTLLVEGGVLARSMTRQEQFDAFRSLLDKTATTLARAHDTAQEREDDRNETTGGEQ